MARIKQGVITKAIAKNKNAKYKITYNKYVYQKVTPSSSNIAYSYSKQISSASSSNLRYKEQ